MVVVFDCILRNLLVSHYWSQTHIIYYLSLNTLEPGNALTGGRSTRLHQGICDLGYPRQLLSFSFSLISVLSASQSCRHVTTLHFLKPSFLPLYSSKPGCHHECVSCALWTTMTSQLLMEFRGSGGGRSTLLDALRPPVHSAISLHFSSFLCLIIHCIVPFSLRPLRL